MVEYTKVGVGLAVIAAEEGTGRVLVGRRKGDVPGTGKLQFPGGHLEPGESFEECAARETLEETGVEVRDVKFLSAINALMPEVGKHYVVIFMGATFAQGQSPKLLEPHKCEFWELWDPKKMLVDTAPDEIFNTIDIFRTRNPGIVSEIVARFQRSE